MFTRSRLNRQFREALALEQGGRRPEARKLYIKIAEEASGAQKAESLSRAAACATWMGDLVAARKLFESARDIEPTSPDHWLNYANSLYRLGDTLGADEAYNEALKYAPDRPDILYYQSVYYADKLSKAGLEGAKRAMRKLVEWLESPNGPLKLIEIGFPRELPLVFLRNLALEKQLIEEGLAALKEFADRPSSIEATAWVRPSALNHRGLLLANAGRQDEALKDYEASLATWPTDEVRFNLGMAQVRRHNWEEARRHLSAYSKNHATSPVATYGMALLAETRGAKDESVRLYKFFLERQARSPVPVQELAALDIERKWIDHAREFVDALGKPSQGGIFEVPVPSEAEGDGAAAHDHDHTPGAGGDVTDKPRGV